MTGSEPVEPLEWKVDLGSELRPRRFVVVVVALLVASVGLFAFRSWILALLGVTVVLASAAEVFLPVWHRLDQAGAHRRLGPSTTQIAWEDVRRVTEDGRGVHLSPLPSESRLNAFRGVYLLTPSNRAEVLGKISALREENGRRLD